MAIQPPNGMPPAEVQQLMMQMIQSNPEMLATLLASKGVQPPSDLPGVPAGAPVPGAARAASGTPDIVRGGEGTQQAMAPNGATLADFVQPQQQQVVAPMSGVAAPTLLPQDQRLSPPGSPGLPGGGAPGFKPGVAELMQMLLASQGQNNQPPQSLGSAIVQR